MSSSNRFTPLCAVVLALGCGGEPAPPSSSGRTDQPRDVTPSLVTPARRLRRLSSREYDNVVRDLLGDTTRPASKFIEDAYQNGYDNGSVGLAVQSDQVVDYQAAAESLAATAVKTRLADLVSGCSVAAKGAAPCVEAFLSGFAARAFRRPLTATEAARLRDAYAAVAPVDAAFPIGIQTLVEIILQSPQLLYREELGAPGGAAVAGSEVRLTDHEVASELSFLLTGSIPDAALWDAVGSGRFRGPDDYRREAKRLLATPAARDTLRAFLHQWLATQRLAALTKDATFYPTFDAKLAASMVGELDRFFDEVLWGGTGSLRELFTSNESYVDPALASLYGVTGPGDGFAPVALDPKLRQGVMTRAGYLAAHAATDSSGPIARGVFVLESILCSPPPPPPANVPPAPAPTDPEVKDLTTRQRFDQHVSSPACAICHKQIDGIGFGFEEFDGIGRHRTTENGHPVDSTGMVMGLGDIDGPYRGASELGARVARSRPLADCFLRQAYRYAMGQVETLKDDLHGVDPSFSAETRMTDLLVSLVIDHAFAWRTVEPNTGN